MCSNQLCDGLFLRVIYLIDKTECFLFFFPFEDTFKKKKKGQQTL